MISGPALHPGAPALIDRFNGRAEAALPRTGIEPLSLGLEPGPQEPVRPRRLHPESG